LWKPATGFRKKVIISPRWIKDVKWQEQTVTINHSKEAVNSPEYDSSNR
jgi:hypothetical protein